MGIVRTKSIDIRVRVDAAKFAYLLSLMPEYEKGAGEKATVVYFAIDTAIKALEAKQVAPQKYISNREYLR